MVLPHSSRAEKVVWLVLQNAFVLGRLVQKLGHCFKKNSSPWIKWIFFKVKMPGKQHTGNTAGHKKERKGSMIIGSLRRWNSESERCHPLKTNKCQEAGREKKTHRWFSSQSTPVGNRGGWNTEKKKSGSDKNRVIQGRSSGLNEVFDHQLEQCDLRVVATCSGLNSSTSSNFKCFLVIFRIA